MDVSLSSRFYIIYAYICTARRINEIKLACQKNVLSKYVTASVYLLQQEKVCSGVMERNKTTIGENTVVSKNKKTETKKNKTLKIQRYPECPKQK